MGHSEIRRAIAFACACLCWDLFVVFVCQDDARNRSGVLFLLSIDVGPPGCVFVFGKKNGVLREGELLQCRSYVSSGVKGTSSPPFTT